ncbi:MAG: 2OG-Fe(II) oxygenase family protein [Polyangiales bacterium]
MTSTTIELPLVDLDDPHGSEALHRGLHETGFFLLADHVIPRPLLDAVREETSAFFSGPAAIKGQYTGPLRGWSALGAESAAAGYGADGERSGFDRCEKFSMGLPVSDETRAANPGYFGAPEATIYFSENRFPNDPMTEVWLQYYAKMQSLCARLVDEIRVSLGLEPGVWDEYLSQPPSLLRFLSYPDHAGGLRMGAHYDDTIVTVLHQSVPKSGFAALQVQLPGEEEWRSVVPSDDVFVVNVGEALTFLSGGRVVATKHRVIGPPTGAEGTARTSLAHFYLPNWNSRLCPSMPRAADGMSTSLDAPEFQEPDGSVLFYKVQQRQVDSLMGKPTE